MKITDPKERLEICKACSFYHPILSLCIVCGCILPVKTKFKNQDCPKGKWEIAEETLDKIN